jgi:membrane associated rhomboid family serine protease
VQKWSQVEISGTAKQYTGLKQFSGGVLADMPGYNSKQITLALPPFNGLVRQLVIANIAVFLVLALLGLAAPALAGVAASMLSLQAPAVLQHWMLWQVLTYGFVNIGVLTILLNMLMVWFFGERLEATFGSKWFGELYFISLLGGAATVLAFYFVPQLQASASVPIIGAAPVLFALLVAWAVFFGEQEILLFFVLRIKVKYLVAIMVLFDFGAFLISHGSIVYAAHLGGGLAGWLYAKYAPRRGFGFSVGEGWFGIRNAWYRRKRKQAAKKFQVYMRDQSKDTHVNDHDKHRDPNDRRWMN